VSEKITEEQVRASEIFTDEELKTERWKPVTVKGYEDYYMVSSLGRVKSLDRLVNYKDGSPRHWKETILKPRINTRDYKQVSLSKEGIIKHRVIHRLVALAFIPNPENKPEVNHLGEEYLTKLNNRVENLAWATSKENSQHASRTGKFGDRKGENHNQSKLTEQQVLQIREEYPKLSYIRLKQDRYKVLANKYNCTINNVRAIVFRQNWKHI